MTQQPFYPQAPVGYPPAPVQQYPQQPAPQYPGYPPQQAYGAPAPQQYAPAPQQPAQPLATGTIDQFYSQPSSGGGKSLKFDQPGTRYVGIVTRPIGNGDIQQQTDIQGRPQFFRDGRPKFVMKVPLQMQPSAEYPDGLAQWFVKGQARDELARAMAEAGAPEGAPENGAVIDIMFTGTRPSGAGMNPAKLFQIRYARPQGAASQSQAPAPAQPAPQPVVQAPVEAQAQAMPPVQQPIPQQQQFAPPQPVPQVQPQAAPVQVAQAPAQVSAPQPPADLSPEQQALLAQLTGQQG